jgi:hypothetical protein
MPAYAIVGGGVPPHCCIMLGTAPNCTAQQRHIFPASEQHNSTSALELARDTAWTQPYYQSAATDI